MDINGLSDNSYKHLIPKGAIFGVCSGLPFPPAWSWDVGYQYHDDLKADAASVNVKTWLIESALRYDCYLQENLSLYSIYSEIPASAIIIIYSD